mgnify:CR=1 FL=1
MGLGYVMEFVLHAELNLSSRNKYLVAGCLSTVPMACFYGAFVGDNYLLVCFVALAGYLVSVQNFILESAEETYQEEKSTHIAEMQEALTTMDSALKVAFIAQNVSLTLSSDKEELSASVAEQAETLTSQNERLKELRADLKKSKSQQAILKRELQEAQQLLEEDATDIVNPLARDYPINTGWNKKKAHRNGAKGKTLRTHRNG